MIYYELISEVSVILIANILRTALLKKILDYFLLVRDLGQRVIKVIYIIYYLVVSVAYCVFQVSVLYELCSLAGIFIVTVLYQDTWKKKLWVSFAFLCMDMGCTLVVHFIFLDIGEMQQPAVSVLLLLICTTFASHISSSADSKSIVFDRKQMTMLILIPVLSVMAFASMMYSSMIGGITTFLCAVIVILNLCVLYLYRILSENYVKLREQDIYKQQVFAYQNQLEVIIESQNRIRALKHDMKNHILTVQRLAQKKQQEELLKYLESMQEFMTNPSEHVYTKNEALDSLLNYKIQKAEERLEKIETDIVIPERMKLHSFDLNVVLGNLLDNAIAASEQTEEKSLKLKMRMEKGILFLYLVNSCKGISEGVCDVKKMSEKSSDGHGMGLSNVKRIIEKYHGELEMNCENQHMITEVLLYVKEL